MFWNYPVCTYLGHGVVKLGIIVSPQFSRFNLTFFSTSSLFLDLSLHLFSLEVGFGFFSQSSSSKQSCGRKKKKTFTPTMLVVLLLRVPPVQRVRGVVGATRQNCLRSR